MLPQFLDKRLERLEWDPEYDAGFSRDVVKAFRKRMQFIRSAPDERDFWALKSLHFEKLKGGRANQRSLRLNDQYRLIVEFKETDEGKVIVIIGIEDYH